MPNASAKPAFNQRLILVDLLAQALLALGIGLATSLALAGAVLLLAAEARAAEAGVPMMARDAQSGTLLLKPRGAGDAFTAPTVSTDIELRVSGPVARATVIQSFRNPHNDWYEGVYVFPLPENAAVDHLRLRIGERRIEGEIREREAAKASYETAKREGRRASLLEQERPNLFTSSVANIGPGETVVVEIEYQQTLRIAGNAASLRVPLAVGPRYLPGKTVDGSQGSGWASNTDQVPDASRITPPVLRAREGAAPVNPLRLKVLLDAGAPIAAVNSTYHPVRVRTLEDGRREITLEDGQYAARDFELAWTLAPGSAPRASLFTEKRGDRTYALLMLTPPAAAAAARLPREAIFVIDTSGSMQGASIAQAKEALELALGRLAPQDHFNVIEFNSSARALYGEARPATRAELERAIAWVRALRADGGTEMAAALRLALDGREHPGRVRQVMFLTDGAVGNEEALFSLIAARLGDSRLFTVGIGSAPNAWFMTRAAQTGRGTFTYIGRIDEVKAKMGELFTRLESPVLTGVSVDWPVGSARTQPEFWPRRVPDLYAGEPVVIAAALDGLEGSVRIRGQLGNAPWSTTVPLTRAASDAGIGVHWAREKISSLMDEMREAPRESRTADELRDAVVRTALDHHLVSRYTSLVAVNRTPVRAESLQLKQGAVPGNLPEGWSHEAVFGAAGELPQGATDSRWQMLLGMLLMLAATLLYRRRVGWNN